MTSPYAAKALRQMTLDSCVGRRSVVAEREGAIVADSRFLNEDQVNLIVVAMLTAVTVVLSLASFGGDVFSVRSLL